MRFSFAMAQPSTATNTKEEPGLMEPVKREPGLLVKEEVVEDSWRDIDEQQRVQETSAIVGSTNVLTSSADLCNVLDLKEELGAIDIGPTVLQHMETSYTINQPDTNVVRQESAIKNNDINPTPYCGVKEETIEDECRESRSNQEVVTTNSGMGNTLPSLHLKIHKEPLQSICRVQLRSLDTSLHVKSRKANKQRRRIAVSSPVVHTCDYCHKTYTTKHSLVHHIDVVHTNVLYRCPECNKEFKGKLYLQRHIRMVHSKEKDELSSPVVHTCDNCHKTYTSKRGLSKHIDVVHTKVLCRCPECNKGYKGKYLLQVHIRREHPKKEHESDTHSQHSNTVTRSEQRVRSQLYSCDKCGKNYAYKESLKRHHRFHSTKSYNCTKCNRKFSTVSYLQTHTNYKHGERRYACAVCKKTYKWQPSLNRHVIQVHRPRSADNTDDKRSNKESQSYSCDKCMKTYATKVSLLAHNESLHSTESLECTKCNKKFPSKAYLSRHTNHAHSEQQYACAVCNKIFKSKRALYQHIYQVHRSRPAEPRIHICDYCQKTFTIKANLAVHITNVHASRSYKCIQCNTSFKCERNLTCHMEHNHTAGSEIRIYICDYCQKKFKNISNLYGHITRVHASGSYNCSQCNKSFKCEQYLMRHVALIHTAGSSQQFTCRNCGRNFTQKWNYLRHEQSVKCTRPTASNTSAVASTNTLQHSVVMVKEEPADGELDLGPVVFQHMDCNYRPYQQEPGLD